MWVFPIFPVLSAVLGYFSDLGLIPTLVGLSILSTYLGIMYSDQSWLKIFWIPAGFLTGRIILITADLIADSTSHNLLPFEIAIYASLSLPVALAAGSLGRWIGKDNLEP